MMDRWCFMSFPGDVAEERFAAAHGGGARVAHAGRRAGAGPAARARRCHLPLQRGAGARARRTQVY